MEKRPIKEHSRTKDLIPIFEIGSKACWVHDSNYSCVLVEYLDKENVIMEWVNEKTKNTVTEDDLMIDSNAEIGYWRYDIRRTATISCNIGTFFELQQRASHRAQFRKSKSSNRVVLIPEESDSSDAGSASDNKHQPSDDSDETDEQDNTTLAKILPPDSRILSWMQKSANLTQCEWEGTRGEPTKRNAPIVYFEQFLNSLFISEVSSSICAS